jgi:hypothetical protein
LCTLQVPDGRVRCISIEAPGSIASWASANGNSWENNGDNNW